MHSNPSKLIQILSYQSECLFKLRVAVVYVYVSHLCTHDFWLKPAPSALGFKLDWVSGSCFLEDMSPKAKKASVKKGAQVVKKTDAGTAGKPLHVWACGFRNMLRYRASEECKKASVLISLFYLFLT